MIKNEQRKVALQCFLSLSHERWVWPISLLIFSPCDSSFACCFKVAHPPWRASFLHKHSAWCQMFQLARLKSPLYVSRPKEPWCSCSHLLLGATKRFYRVEFSRRGAVQLAGTLICAANKKQTRFPPSPLSPCMQMWPLLHCLPHSPSTMQLSCLPPAAWGGKPCRLCVKHTRARASNT